MLSQTQAIAVYCAKLAGLQPEDPWDAAKVDECLNGCTDVTGTVGQTFRLPDTEKLEARAKLIAPNGRRAPSACKITPGMPSVLTGAARRARAERVADLAASARCLRDCW